ncbi:MAG: ferritin family protein [Bacteroidales bacterium]|nr:ferritin family protein [Candidatus Latescibacterota bacterium]
MTDGKSLDFNNVDEVFDYAIEKEKEARDFYLEWAGKIEKPAIQKVFTEFAAQEEGHMKLFTSMKEGHAETRPETKAVDLHLTDYLIEAEPTENMGYREALRVAIQREQAAMDLYSAFAKATKSPEIASTMETLVAEETKHKNRLESIYDDDFYPEN